MRILITAARSYTAYYWALAHMGHHTIHFADSLHASYCRFAPFKSTFHLVAGPAIDAKQFRNDIRNIVQQHQIDLIIPTCEEVFYLSAFAHELSCEVFSPSHDLLVKLHNKSTVFELLPNAGGVLKPITRAITRPDEIDNALDSILKPVFSRFGAHVVMDARADGARALNGTEPWVQQQRLDGQALCNYAIARDGKLLAHSTYQAKQRIRNSAALLMKAVTRPEIEAFTLAFVQEHNYTGQVAFDFIDTSSGLYVIECNPRATSGLFFLDIDQLNHAMHTQSRVTNSPCKTIAFKQIMKIYNLLGLLHSGQGHDYKSEVEQARDVLAHPYLPMPGKIASIALLELIWRRIRHGIKLTEASTYDIEWNGNHLKF